MKTLVLIVTVVFLFGGIYMVGAYSKSIEKKHLNTDANASIQNAKPSYSIKQIDNITSKLNYSFTSVNQKGISPYYIH